MLVKWSMGVIKRGGRGVKKYRDSHKALAMAYVRDGRPVAEVCAELSVSKSALHSWLAEDRKRREFEGALLQVQREADELKKETHCERQFDSLPSEMQPLLVAVEALLKEIKRLSIASSGGR